MAILIKLTMGTNRNGNTLKGLLIVLRIISIVIDHVACMFMKIYDKKQIFDELLTAFRERNTLRDKRFSSTPPRLE